MNTLYYLAIALLFIANQVLAQGATGSTAAIEPRYIVDLPTAGLLEKGNFAINIMALNEGGLMTEITAAPFKNFNMGISYSCTNFIGSGDISGQNIPGVTIKLRIFNETIATPAILIGLSTQGKGIYYKSQNRFQTLSPGAFLSSSKSFHWLLGAIAFHGGINYSFEPPKENRALNCYIGLEQSIGEQLSLNFEYNANIDDTNKEFMSRRGMLNSALRFSISNGLTLELQFRDLLKNQAHASGFTRFFGFEFVGHY